MPKITQLVSGGALVRIQKQRGVGGNCGRQSVEMARLSWMVLADLKSQPSNVWTGSFYIRVDIKELMVTIRILGVPQVALNS